MGLLAAATAVSLAIPAWERSEPSTSRVFLAGSGGMNGGRQAGDWVLRHVPRGTRLLAIGPSAANVLEFYGHHPVSALSVSTNPRDRNPSYAPVLNPTWPCARVCSSTSSGMPTPPPARRFFAAEARRLASKFHGVAVFTSAITVRASAGPACRAGLHHLRGAPMKLRAAASAIAAVLRGPGLRGPCGGCPRQPHGRGRAGTHHAATPIKHFVFLMQGGRTFDNYFGTYPGADGPPPGTCQPRAQDGRRWLRQAVPLLGNSRHRWARTARSSPASTTAGR